MVVVLHRLQAHLLQPFAPPLLQFWQHQVTVHQHQQVRHLTDMLRLLLGHRVGLVLQSGKGVVGCPCHRYTALETVGVVVHHAIQRVGCAAHRHIPQQVCYMHIHRLHRTCLPLVAAPVVALPQHDAEIAHARTPFLRHRVRLGRKAEGVLPLRIVQPLGKVRHRVVHRQIAHWQFRLLRLLLLILGSLLLVAPLLLLHQV